MSIYEEIAEERKRQDALWGGPDHDDRHHPNDWILFIVDHAMRAFHDPHKNFRTQMIRVAALAVAAIETADRHAKFVKEYPGV